MNERATLEAIRPYLTVRDGLRCYMINRPELIRDVRSLVCFVASVSFRPLWGCHYCGTMEIRALACPNCGASRESGYLNIGALITEDDGLLMVYHTR